MASYKEGNERMSQTGVGMDGIELSTYQQWVTNNVCKYYFELDSVLRDRPNVRPWATNEKIMRPNNNIQKTADNMHIDYSVLDDDIDSVPDDDHNNRDSQYCVIDEEREVVQTTRDNDEYDEYDGSLSEDTNNTSIDTTFNSSCDEYPSSSTMSGNKKKNEISQYRGRQLLPSEAKGIQRNLLKKKEKKHSSKE